MLCTAGIAHHAVYGSSFLYDLVHRGGYALLLSHVCSYGVKSLWKPRRQLVEVDTRLQQVNGVDSVGPIAEAAFCDAGANTTVTSRDCDGVSGMENCTRVPTFEVPVSMESVLAIILP